VKISVEKIDKRVIDRYVSAGLINKAQLDAYLSSLPDLADACEDISDIVFNNGVDGKSIQFDAELTDGL